MSAHPASAQAANAHPTAARGATRILAIRHGQTDWNRVARVQGHEDVPLNADGRVQAERVAQALVGERVAAVVSSDLARAWDTARAIARVTGAPLVADLGLRERHYGAWQGLTIAEAQARWPEDVARWRASDPDFAPDGGEANAAFFARCVAAAQRIARQYDGRAVVLVAHGGVLDMLYRAAADVPLDVPRSWALPNAAINRLHWDGQRLRASGWGDTAHLDDAPACDDTTTAGA